MGQDTARKTVRIGDLEGLEATLDRDGNRTAVEVQDRRVAAILEDILVELRDIKALFGVL